MATQSSQLSLADVFTECQDLLHFDKPLFFALLEKHLDFDAFIPSDFYRAFNRRFGRNREYPLHGFISSLILQKILSIPTDSLLIILLHLSKELRAFCGFDKIPDPSKFTRFKQDFLPFIEQLFNHLVDYTEPICQAIDPFLASTITFDTIDTYSFLKNNCHFSKALIPWNQRNQSDLPAVGVNTYGYPLCPSDASLPMKRLGRCHEKGRSDRIFFCFYFAITYDFFPMLSNLSQLFHDSLQFSHLTN